MSDWKAGLAIIPAHMHDSIRLYVEHGISGGGFLDAVLCNDLKGAFRRADTTNKMFMEKWVEFVVWYLPVQSQGSPEAVLKWMKHGGLNGLHTATVNDVEPRQDIAEVLQEDGDF